ncbi:restriction endonuclease subunit S [Listeria innocua]|uniref:restriction endonuclease subunit S n=1 Tax=Listeria innocua TaxID=1642 RepID=UPI001624898D|nr:restriction endonuclease subunit S [Listeria innocua]MBC1351949.1 restriction endonuclease subunit S [Listeria innocua]
MKKLEKSVPIIRFKGFYEAWEQRKLGDHAKYRRGSFPQPYGNKEWYDGEGAMPFVQVVDVTSKLTLVENTKQKISKLAQPKSVFVPKGKVIVTLQGSIGRIAITQYDSFVDRTLLIFDDYEKETDERFWAYTIQKKFEIEKLKAPGVTIKTITKEALSSFDVHLPQFEEQQKIGILFKQLDDTIALHQRKLDTLKLMKKGFLQRMFPNNEEEIPKVRFADFDGMWKQRKLNSITEKITRKNKELESTLPLTISAQDGLIDQNEYFNKIIASRNIRGYFLVKNGEFAYNKSYSKGYPWGVVKRLDNYNMGVLSTLYIIFKPVKINSDFLTKYFDSTYWYRAVSQFATEGARNHGLLNIAASDFFEIELNIPLNNEEQKKIGLFFQQLENIIILHQNKLEKLSILKKTYLKKMFI